MVFCMLMVPKQWLEVPRSIGEKPGVRGLPNSLKLVADPRTGSKASHILPSTHQPGRQAEPQLCVYALSVLVLMA